MVIQRLLTLTIDTRVVEDVRVIQILSRVLRVFGCDVRGLSFLEGHRARTWELRDIDVRNVDVRARCQVNIGDMCVEFNDRLLLLSASCCRCCRPFEPFLRSKSGACAESPRLILRPPRKP